LETFGSYNSLHTLQTHAHMHTQTHARTHITDTYANTHIESKAFVVLATKMDTRRPSAAMQDMDTYFGIAH